ncbi:unnamed protein product [Penicillium salamii]|nr:unnamed protein product [Penicillium salamii]
MIKYVHLRQPLIMAYPKANPIPHQAKDIVIFYGTQSGTSYELARALSREISRRFSKPTLLADMSDYDCKSIADIPSTKLALFIVSTYSEGDPPDNAMKYDEWLQTIASNDLLKNLRFATLGLGNSNYKHYNRFAVKSHGILQKCGAQPIMDLVLADDAQGLTQETFLSWKTTLSEIFVQRLGIPEQPKPYEPVIRIKHGEIIGDNTTMYRPIDPQMKSKGADSTIYPAAVTCIRNITPGSPRITLHIEIDISNQPKLKYSVGDHLAVWPENPSSEIDNLCGILGITKDELHRPLAIHSEDIDTPVPWPQPVSLQALFKHHLDIVGLISRDLVMSLKQFAKDHASQKALDDIVRDYKSLCRTHRMTLASVLRLASSGSLWTVPTSFVLENLRHLKPRFYSIASTPVINPRKISFTVAVKDVHLTDGDVLRGLASNYFLEMQQQSDKNAEPQLSVWCSVQKSKFKPPVSPTQPMIMVANGSGIAPFIGFLRHRLRTFRLKGDIGQMKLFYGCQDEQMYLYKDEIEEIQAAFDGQLEVFVAYSRAGGGYVQGQVKAHHEGVAELLANKTNLYICGSTAMAREVREEVLAIMCSYQGNSPQQAQLLESTYLKMKKWQLDVWG